MAAPARLTVAQYFDLESSSEVRHELVDGHVYAMTGGTPLHARLQSRLGAVLSDRLPEGCDTYGSDLRIALPGDAYFFPDHTVICGEIETEDGVPSSVVNPLIIFEVLSDSTEDFDRGRKAALYRRIPRLQAIVLVSQDRPEVEVQSRSEDGSWILRLYVGRDATAVLDSVGTSLPLAELYAGIEFSAER